MSDTGTPDLDNLDYYIGQENIIKYSSAKFYVDAQYDSAKLDVLRRLVCTSFGGRDCQQQADAAS